MNYCDFFFSVTGFRPYPYQERLGNEAWPELLEVSTGLGKTAAVIVAWLYKRAKGCHGTPRRLVYCLPMRVLVEQTCENARDWVEKASPYFKDNNVARPTVHLLLGGEDDAAWAERPEEPAIIVGTQDMLLSRALMRGYGMSRYQWPVHFAALHNDAFWVFDEIQLMGAGLTTSAQLEAFRRRYAVARACASLWVSATLNRAWLDTVDLRPHLHDLRHVTLTPEEQETAAIRSRRAAVKRLSRASTTFTAENQKQSAKAYCEALAQEVLSRHLPGTTTLVILNTVERVQGLLQAVMRLKPAADLLLVHSRYRQLERKRINGEICRQPDAAGAGRIVIATQAVEAGVDMTCRVLFTELAPWSSLVQRFGRCNRYGEADVTGGADVFWVDLEQTAKLETPYEEAELTPARGKLEGLLSASAADLPGTDQAAPLHMVLRAKDFRDLFNTDPDLSGFDVDVSPYIRDADDLDVQVFWRDLSQGVDDQPQPCRDEICRASLGQAKALLDRMRKLGMPAYRWDGLDGKWRKFQGNLRPGLNLLLDVKAGGYSNLFGFLPSSTDSVALVEALLSVAGSGTFGDDWRSRAARDVELHQHLRDADAHAKHLCQHLNEEEEKETVLHAARWHDSGKSHVVMQATLHDCLPDEAVSKTPLLAKSSSTRRHHRKYFRHEVASMLAWLEHSREMEKADLIAYLILAHHGKVRLSLRGMPDEKEPVKPLGPRFARGVWEGDVLPQLEIPAHGSVPPTTLKLDLMELGEGAMGPSWTARTQKLLDKYGPFRLAWLEMLVRVADWRASADEQGEDKP